MKKIVFFVFAVLASVFTSFGQDRINEPTYSFKNKSNLITNITGWRFDELEGQWFGNANRIIGNKYTYINSIQIKTFEKDGIINYILIIAYNDSYQVYSLTKDEYETIISPNVYHDYTLPCEYFGSYYKQKTDNSVIRQIIRNKTKRTDISLGLSIKRYNDVIRFNFEVWIYETYWGSVKSLEKEYFEISITEWEKLKIE